jgi:hypothetical protein
MSNRLLVSTRKGLFSLLRASDGWQITGVSFLGENVTLALPDPRDGRWYATLNLGHFGVKLKGSSDEGKTWEELAVPTYAEGDSIATGDGKPPAPATLKLIWALEPGSVKQPGRLWAGTAPGGLFRSDDHGRSWQLIRELWDRPERARWFGGGLDTPGIHSINIDPRDDRVIRVGVSCAGVWRSDDDGKTWRTNATGMFAEYMPPELKDDPNIQDPHRMVQCPSDPETLWVQHHNGIFHSRNGGEQWHHVPNNNPSSFGFGVAVHPREPQTAWFVPAVKDECRVPVNGQLVVTRTRDGGKNFDVLRDGLPQEHSYDIIYRHALDVDTSGDRLAIGSTTGGLWISENQGDRWQNISSNLPPIHAVRFF